MRKESEMFGGRKLLRGIVRRELREFVYHGCVFRGRDEYPVCGKVHAATLARRNTMTVGVAPFYNVVDGSLQLSFNHAHVRTFTTDL
ncbi:hypothetical protein TNCV_306421 [Trichonephila clavipes]|nr:hypothetical protein TNCV_306421 [Trichonephila clavipes]